MPHELIVFYFCIITICLTLCWLVILPKYLVVNYKNTARIFGVFTIIMPILAYGLLGHWQFLSKYYQPGVKQERRLAEKVRPVLASLKKRQFKLQWQVAKEPENTKLWSELAYVYELQNNLDLARQAYYQAFSKSNDHELLLKAIQSGIALNEGKLDEKTEEYLDIFLKSQPAHPMGLHIQALAHYQNRQYQQALQIWQKLKKNIKQQAKEGLHSNHDKQKMLAPTDTNILMQENSIQTEILNLIEPLIARAETLELQPHINVQLKIASRFSGSMDQYQKIFVVAKSHNNPAPLAVVEIKPEDITKTITIGVEDAMLPSHTIADAEEIILEARASQNGQAEVIPGDIVSDKVILIKKQIGKAQTYELNISRLMK